jgi:HEAT repeat protein
VYWPLWGWFQGETFYRGKPTSFYREHMKDWPASYWKPGGIGWFRERLHLERAPRPDPFVNADPGAMPVLLELLHDEDFLVRYRAVQVCAGLDTDPIAMRALAIALRDENEIVRAIAEYQLLRLGPRAVDAVPVLVEYLVDRRPKVRSEAAFLLGKIGASDKATVPALLQGLNDEDEGVRDHIAEVLRSITTETLKKKQP